MNVLPVAAALMTAVATAGVALPFMRPHTQAPEKLTDPLEAERLSLLRALRELEADRAAGAIRETDYQMLRQKTEREAVAVLRRLKAREGSRELAAALGRRHPQPAAAGKGSRAGLLAGLVVAAAIVAASVPLLASAMASRAPGGLITGQPASGAGTSGDPLGFFEQRVQAHPGDTNARLDLARQLEDVGRPQQAAEQYLAVLQLDPRNTEAQTRIGMLLLGAGLPDQALKAVDQALQIDPSYPEALYGRGIILLKGLRRPSEAASSLSAYLKAAPFGGHRAEVESLLRAIQAGQP